MNLTSIIICPKCNHSKPEKMPENILLMHYQCESCNETIEPIEGDCCVFCSFGSELCPSQQEKKRGSYC